MLPHYTVLQQTMKSSCGLCAVTAVMKYYGAEGTHYDLELTALDIYEKYMAFIRANLEEGKPVVVSTNVGGGHFLTVIGIDNMGTDYIYDDVLIIADSNDYWDGYQDGFSAHCAYRFFRHHTNNRHTVLQSIIVLEKN